jgi:hypothetical protein
MMRLLSAEAMLAAQPDCALGCALQVCGGKVLHCLTESKDQIKSEQCKKEVFYYEKMEVSDFRVDATLAEACRADVTKFCPKVEPGEWQAQALHTCCCAAGTPCPCLGLQRTAAVCRAVLCCME